MKKYILNKTQKGAKFLYEVIEVSSNKVVTTRTSARDYVACTISGEFFFGRLDLVGKGDHGRILNRSNAILSNPHKVWLEDTESRSKAKTEDMRERYPFDSWKLERVAWAEGTLQRCEIAYLGTNNN